jgi:hypothetical protein
MLPRASRCTSSAVAVLLAVAILVALAGSSAHAGHGCLVDQDCLACRWSADSVALAPPPPVLPVPESVALVSPAAPDQTAPRPRTPGRSRAPPRG